MASQTVAHNAATISPSGCRCSRSGLKQISQECYNSFSRGQEWLKVIWFDYRSHCMLLIHSYFPPLLHLSLFHNYTHGTLYTLLHMFCIIIIDILSIIFITDCQAQLLNKTMLYIHFIISFQLTIYNQFNHQQTHDSYSHILVLIWALHSSGKLVFIIDTCILQRLCWYTVVIPVLEQ